MSKKYKLTFEFTNEEAIHDFALWLCESGEQQYWDWQENVEEDYEEGDITVVAFEYHKRNPDGSYGEFLEENVIKCICGRLDKDG